MSPQGRRVHVDAMPPRGIGYDIYLRQGALGVLAARAAAAAPAAAYVIIVPHSIAGTHGAAAVESFRAAGLRVELLAFDDAERAKTRETWAELSDRMLDLRLGRDTCVVALGGGVTGDVAGFVAATYMRGLQLVQVPTTLLAMIDASIGGKTGVDTGAGKNLIGAFHPPRLVLIDPLLLQTLPRTVFIAGLAEAVKHGAILDAAYFDWINASADALVSFDPAALERLISRSVELKGRVVSEDPYEQGRRAILNFGHTVAHALETRSAYELPHGFAVAIGMCVEARIGELSGRTAPGTARQIEQLLETLQLPTTTDATCAELFDAMRVDKKARAAQPRFVLLRRIGECDADPSGAWTHAVPPELVERAFQPRSAPAADV